MSAPVVSGAPCIAVIGGSSASADALETAHEVGRTLAEAGAVLVCGGLGGVMEAAARGCAEAGGTSVGILPGHSIEQANQWIRIPLPSGMGEARNALVVRGGEAVIAVEGSWGTLSEIALARAMGKPVVTVGRGPVPDLDVPSVGTAREAVAWALERVIPRAQARPGTAGEDSSEAIREDAPG